MHYFTYIITDTLLMNDRWEYVCAAWTHLPSCPGSPAKQKEIFTYTAKPCKLTIFHEITLRPLTNMICSWQHRLCFFIAAQTARCPANTVQMSQMSPAT